MPPVEAKVVIQQSIPKRGPKPAARKIMVKVSLLQCQMAGIDQALFHFGHK